jgi:hypothetical protein
VTVVASFSFFFDVISSREKAVAPRGNRGQQLKKREKAVQFWGLKSRSHVA